VLGLCTKRGVMNDHLTVVNFPHENVLPIGPTYKLHY